jgi:hypothetical protein
MFHKTTILSKSMNSSMARFIKWLKRKSNMLFRLLPFRKGLHIEPAHPVAVECSIFKIRTAFLIL